MISPKLAEVYSLPCLSETRSATCGNNEISALNMVGLVILSSAFLDLNPEHLVSILGIASHKRLPYRFQCGVERYA